MSRQTELARAEASEELLSGPIRGELLGAEHLAARARSVARGQRVAFDLRPLRSAPLLVRLDSTRRILRRAQARLVGASAAGVDCGPASEWLLDNFHVVQEHLDEVRDSLPAGYYRELPELISGPLAGYPRVYEIAISMISHSEARIDLATVDVYTEAFQSVKPLNIGELWAMPAMLRLGLIESVRRMTLRTVQRLDEIDAAVAWADRIISAERDGRPDLRAALREFSTAELSLTPHFVSRFLQTIRQADGASAPLEWLEHWLREVGVSPENALARSTERLALTQIMMANSISSLRDIGRRDWRRFVEHQSAMEAVLRQDPSGDYRLMTFATRDAYRHAVERIAKQTGQSEVSVASRAVDLARAYALRTLPPTSPETRRRHVGYFLVDDGLPILEAATGYRPRWRERFVRLSRSRPNVVFVGGLVLCTWMATLAVMLIAGHERRGVGWWPLLFAFLPALDLAITALNHLVTTWLPPRVLAKMDLHEHGVSAECRTAVVIPTLFGDVDDVRNALDNLEVQFLANREPNLHFAVLSDFTDAATAECPGDAAIVESALAGIRALNDRHAPDTPDVFHLLHRSRQWNAQQGVWMGWERKRGKLAQFNRLLRGEQSDAFSVISSDTVTLQGVRYVITLDADTMLPPDAAPALVGAMAHPLNRAVYDETSQRMVHGYGILQPRVGVSLPSAHRSRFAAIASGHPGVDPYSTAVSDVYQDLFGEGSFTGKGIYDVDAFERATHGRFPENMLLSHDLLEGNYARAGLATDVIVYDDYPSTYIGCARRKHRWIRGDWQLLPWLRRRVPGPHGLEPNRLSLVSQWKIVDNLRRSTVELSQVAFFVAGWTILPGSAVRWTLLGIGAVVAPWVMALLRALAQPPLDKSWRAYYGAVARDAWVSLQQATVALVFLPHQAWISLDAIGRTVYRLLVSRRHLLEWKSASLVEAQTSDPGHSSWRTMRTSVSLVAVAALLISADDVRRIIANGQPVATLLPTAVVMWTLVVAWLCAPWIAARLSRPDALLRQDMSPTEREQVLRYARLHWSFFDRFVTAETQWLAPDNFQSDPEPVVAMRTSPTNIGLQLLATVSAHDLGLITAVDMVVRLERAFDTLASLRRYRGHFYNWYDLHDRRVLEPAYISTVDSGNLAGHLIALRQACLEVAHEESALAGRLTALATKAYDLAANMEFGFLYDAERKLFTIGYHPESLTADDSFYDLLASEARLASFIAIAKNDVPVAHWFRLSRSLNRTSGAMALVSWSGSMFEYLMPLLVMRSLPATLLDQTYHSVIDRQKTYARLRGVPWGMSESAYNVRDRQDTYQYRAFGIADLALKRGLGRDLVIAPYASALAALVNPKRALANLQALEAVGALGDYGFCDALDYTRPDPDARFAVVRTYMAHHVGMTIVALTNVLQSDRWQDRFHADPLVKSVELLLHERVPRRLAVHAAQTARPDDGQAETDREGPSVRDMNTVTPAPPRVALLGSRAYTVMLNHSGSGYSRYESLAVTRWRADSTSDDAGQFCYVRDLTTGRVWSTGTQPIGAAADESRACLAADRVTLQRRDGAIETKTEITVVPGDAAEVRRVTLSNSASTPHDIELTSYGEIVMAPPNADRAHPAFSKLFVETEWHAWCSAITATRRPRTPDEPRLWCVHVVDAGVERIGPVTCETDRAHFIGRGRSVRDPVALDVGAALSGTTGAVLDPVFALRTCVRVAPGQSVSVTFTTLVATTRAMAFELAGRYHDAHAGQRALDLAWSATRIELQELGVSATSASLFQDLATQLLFRGGSLAPPADEVRRNRGSQPRLWSYALSGDLPIVLATIDAIEGLPTLRELFVAHRYWQLRGLVVDLVVVNAQPYDYLQELRDGVNDAMVSANDAALVDQPGGVFVRRRDTFLADDYLMLSATARMHVPCDGRTLARILASADARDTYLSDADLPDGHLADAHVADPSRTSAADMPTTERGRGLTAIVSVLRPLVAPLLLQGSTDRTASTAPTVPVEPLLFDNGIGGLTASGDYRITVSQTQLPPVPWVNVIANPSGGFIVSERGTGCTWAESAYFYRLTPWHNDPVVDPACDVVYLQDLDTGVRWSATPAPVRTTEPYRIRHAPGSSTFDHAQDGITTELLLGMPEDAAVKLSVLRVTNHSRHRRRLALTAFVEWTLGTRRELTQHQVYTRYVAEDGAILAKNHFDLAFTEWTSFLAISEPVTSHSADRLSFIGQDGSLEDPAALRMAQLDGVTGVQHDPCGALQMQMSLAPGEMREVVVLLGAARTERDARRTIARLRVPGAAREAIAQSVAAWDARLSVVTVRTPDAAFDAMMNKWTLYQALACRMWARAGLYQSSGAYGFRDQLQDVLAFVYAEPAIARAHILRAASRQFVEGDVQHWWHPHSGNGVRTRFSDDLVWLPYAVDQYVRVTGDHTVLSEYVPFLSMRALAPDEHERYDLPSVTDEHADVYEHCRRALRRACTAGQHGLPLIGTGDWNDGMSLVGAKGQGESIWLAWFLIATLRAFAVHADGRGDNHEAAWMRTQADAYQIAVEAHGWDGQWYRRAYYDDGAPLGSSGSDECRIDSLAQSWSVISGAGSNARATQAMRALNTELVREEDRIILLLSPPFDRGAHDPGYIKGYLPGVRENGAQYTHAALWAVMATAMQGNGDRAFDLFQMLNPLTHSDSKDAMLRYKVEPFVVPADVYSAPSHVGRGGWTWYTGSASWMYRIGLEQLLGFRREGDTLSIHPRVPEAWPSYEIRYRFGTATYAITVQHPSDVQRGGAQVSVDKVIMPDGRIRLVDDGRVHTVIVAAIAVP